MQNPPVKVVLLGQNGCGKTSIMNRFIRREFQDNYTATIGAAYASAAVKANNGHVVKLDIWDTAGSEVYRAVSRLYYRSAKAAIVCYDITSRMSYKDLFYWVEQLKTYERECKIYICGTKLDLINSNQCEREVSLIDVKNFAESYGYTSIETSSKYDINITNLFKSIVDDASIQPRNNIHVKMEMRTDEESHKRCCVK